MRLQVKSSSQTIQREDIKNIAEAVLGGAASLEEVKGILRLAKGLGIEPVQNSPAFRILALGEQANSLRSAHPPALD